MFYVLAQMGALIGFGAIWRALRPGGMEMETVRFALTAVVYNVLLPALVLLVLWEAPLGVETVRIAAAAGAGVLGAMLLSWLSCRACTMPRAVTGAAILAASFPNATYLGLPVLEATLGPWARSIAIQYDLFACTPLLLTLGVAVAQRFGDRPAAGSPVLNLLKVPPLWAALLAAVLNFADVPQPRWIHDLLQLMGSGVVPLMLLSLGMSLHWSSLFDRSVRSVLPVLVIQLGLMPLGVWAFGGVLGLEGQNLMAVALEGAMPSMVLGIVICDRYGLDTALYAATVTLSTLISLLTLPFWFDWLGAGPL